MRIRKHAKISPLLYTASFCEPGTVIQTHVCKLNQSRWDVGCFSPPSSPELPSPPSLAIGLYTSAVNADSDHIIPPLPRLPELNSPPNSDENPHPQPLKNRPSLCCKTDGKSWKCRREAAKNHSLCEHHLSLVKSYSKSSQTTAKKSDKHSAPSPPPPSNTKRTKSSSSHPYEFYYYSGFGPRWAKKRGVEIKDRNNSRFDTGEDEQKHEYGNYGSDFLEEEEEEEEEPGNGKKRGRKRIKARSLKSLM